VVNLSTFRRLSRDGLISFAKLAPQAQVLGLNPGSYTFPKTLSTLGTVYVREAFHRSYSLQAQCANCEVGKDLCPVLCPPPNPTERDGVSPHRWKPLLDETSVTIHNNS
jgi:hypothetical protein